MTCQSGYYELEGALQRCVGSERCGHYFREGELNRCATSCNETYPHQDGNECVCSSAAHYAVIAGKCTCDSERGFVSSENGCACDPSSIYKFIDTGEDGVQICSARCQSGYYEARGDALVCVGQESCPHYVQGTLQRECVAACNETYPHADGAECMCRESEGFQVINDVCRCNPDGDLKYLSIDGQRCVESCGEMSEVVSPGSQCVCRRERGVTGATGVCACDSANHFVQ